MCSNSCGQPNRYGCSHLLVASSFWHRLPTLRRTAGHELTHAGQIPRSCRSQRVGRRRLADCGCHLGDLGGDGDRWQTISNPTAANLADRSAGNPRGFVHGTQKYRRTCLGGLARLGHLPLNLSLLSLKHLVRSLLAPVNYGFRRLPAPIALWARGRWLLGRLTQARWAREHRARGP